MLKSFQKDSVGDRSSKDSKTESPASSPESSDEKHLECLEPLPEMDDDEGDLKKVECKQSTRIREMKRQQSREHDNGLVSDSQAKSPEEDVSVDVVNSPESSSDVSEPQSDSKSDIPLDEVSLEVGDKVQVKYGRGRNHRHYDAKVWWYNPWLFYCFCSVFSIFNKVSHRIINSFVLL